MTTRRFLATWEHEPLCPCVVTIYPRGEGWAWGDGPDGTDVSSRAFDSPDDAVAAWRQENDPDRWHDLDELLARPSRADVADFREWLVTNGLGGFACGTVAGAATRAEHAAFVAKGYTPTKAITPADLERARTEEREECAKVADERLRLCADDECGDSVPAWQRCPVCDGTGVHVSAPDGLSAFSSPCPKCNGHRVIGIADGRAPEGEP